MGQAVNKCSNIRPQTLCLNCLMSFCLSVEGVWFGILIVNGTNISIASHQAHGTKSTRKLFKSLKYVSHISVLKHFVPEGKSSTCSAFGIAFAMTLFNPPVSTNCMLGNQQTNIRCSTSSRESDNLLSPAECLMFTYYVM